MIKKKPNSNKFKNNLRRLMKHKSQNLKSRYNKIIEKDQNNMRMIIDMNKDKLKRQYKTN